MQYLGGKSRIAVALSKEIARLVEEFGAHSLYEPFCGGCSVTAALAPLLPGGVRYFASDSHPSVIALWTALQSGWMPPDSVSEQEYQDIRARQKTDALDGFVGFGCSFGAKYWAGYARGGHGADAATASRSCFRKIKSMPSVSFACVGYQDLQVHDGSGVYCDPPYAESTGYKQGAFDHNAFWQWATKMSEHNLVLVSEYKAPPDWVPAMELPKKLGLRTTANGQEVRIEKLFIHISRSDLL